MLKSKKWVAANQNSINLHYLEFPITRFGMGSSIYGLILSSMAQFQVEFKMLTYLVKLI